MSIPKYDELTWPLLELLKDGQPRSTDQAAAALSDRFQLTDEERSSLLPSGGQTYMVNRAGWAGFHLDRAGLATRPQRGRWQITPAGLKLLDSPPIKLDRNSLMRFELFREYMGREKGAFAPKETPDVDAPPEEVIASAFNELQTQLKQEL